MFLSELCVFSPLRHCLVHSVASVLCKSFHLSYISPCFNERNAFLTVFFRFPLQWNVVCDDGCWSTKFHWARPTLSTDQSHVRKSVHDSVDSLPLLLLCCALLHD